MNDLDVALTGALNAAAHSDEVHIERLLTGARVSGLRYRRRRRVLLTGGSALAVILPVLLVVVGLSFFGGGPGRAIQSGSGPVVPSATQTPAPATAVPSPVAADPTTGLPLLDEATSIKKLPSVVGRGAFHIGLAGVSFAVATVQWTSGAGLERVVVTPDTVGRHEPVTVLLTRASSDLTSLTGSKQNVTVGTHRATLIDASGDPQAPYTVVRWQPSTGLWAEVSGSLDAKAALTLATQVTFERTYACVVPFEVRPPKGTLAGKVSACSVSYAAGSWTGQFTYDYGNWLVDLARADEAGMDFKETIGGRPAWTDRGDGGGGASPTLRVQVSYGGNRVADLKASGRYSTTTVANLASAYVMIDSPSPAEWWQVPTG